MAEALNGIQPREYLLESGLETRQRSLAFLNCLRRVAYSSAMACTVWECSGMPSKVALLGGERSLGLASGPVTVEWGPRDVLSSNG